MVNLSEFKDISPYVRMMRLKKAVSMSGKWRDIDNVFTYIAAGEADFILDGVRYPLQTGNAIIIPPYMTHVIISQGSEALVQYIIHFDFFETEMRKQLIHKDVLDEEDLQQPLEEKEHILKDQPVIAEIPETERNLLMARYLRMTREFNGNRPGKDLMLKAGCMEILVSTLRNCIDLGGQLKNDGGRAKSWIHIENAIDYILSCDLNSGGLDNESIAAAIGVSPNYLTRVFQTNLGISLHKYIMNVRVERAQQLLLSGKVNVTEAADRTGFSSIHVFSKSFKSILGISPSQFLNETVNREHIAENLSEILELV